MPNASVGIDRLRALLGRARSGQSAAATRFHRRAVRWALAIRRSLAPGPPEPQPAVTVVHLVRRAPVEARIEVETAFRIDPRSDRTGSSSRASNDAAGAPPNEAAGATAGAAPGVQESLATDRSIAGSRSTLPPTSLRQPARSVAPRAARRTGFARGFGRGNVAPTSFRRRDSVGVRLSGLRRRSGILLTVIGRAVAHERAAAATVAAILVFASFASALPAFGGPPTGDVGGPGATPRLVVGGGVLGPPASDTPGGAEISGPDGWTDEPFDDFGVIGGGDLAGGGDAAGGPTGPLARLADPEASAGTDGPAGPFLADGTLLKPVAVDTRVPDARDRIVLYRVQSGDTLTGIARRFGISMMTLWWANDLSSKDELHVGQILRIPPVDGLVVTVKDGDTLDAIAAETGIAKETIAAFNGLTDDGLVVGQVLIVPGARGEAIPTPKPTPRPVVRTVTRSTGGTVREPSSYSGGALRWPVAGGYLSQYYHYGHYGIDIAADYGTRVLAAAAGTVIFAGWKSNGGGYQVWISHGSGLYTGYYHMSAVSVGRGQSVARGQTIGRIGSSGWSTGPHLHFEVWRGYPWEPGSSRVNPLRYL